MSQYRFIRLAMLFAALSLPLGATYAAEAKNAAEAKKVEESARETVVKPLNAIAELVNAKKYPEALAKLAEAEANKDITPYERFFIERSRAAIASANGDEATLLKTLETLLNTDRLAAAERQSFLKNLIGANYNKKDYAKSISWIQQFYKEGNKDPQIQELLVRAYYTNNEFENSLKESRNVLVELEKAGKVPEEDQINIYRNSAVKLKDLTSFTDALEKLVTYYPKPEYWSDLLGRLESSRTVADRLILDLYRLRLASVKTMSEADAKEMAELALLAVLPAEAKKVLEAGFKDGVLGVGSNAAEHKKLLDKATKSAADDLKNIAQGEVAANKSKEGNGLVNVGFAYVSQGQFDKGISLMEQGIKVGKLKQPEDAKLHLAEAYMLANRKDDAIQTFKSVQGDEGLSTIARYWLLFLGAK
jgi:uncharacterized protein Smg (DUF494 family)